MKANVTYKSDEADSFVVTGSRTKWYWTVDNNTATFRRVEIEKDDHSTNTSVVLFGEEWVNCMEFVETLPFVEEIAIQEELG